MLKPFKTSSPLKLFYYDCVTLYIRVRHIFLFSSTGFIKIQFGGHFIALGQGISKLFLFFFWDEYFSNNLTSKFGIPCSKVWKIFFSNIVVWRIKRRVLEHWTQISNQFSEMSKNVRLTCEKPCFLENFRILQLFYYLCRQFSWFLKNDSIFMFSVSMRFFWTVTRLYLKKKKFNFTTGDPKLRSQNIQEI